jgi:arabinosaccharide transport system substrate-binding protein
MKKKWSAIFAAIKLTFALTACSPNVGEPVSGDSKKAEQTNTGGKKLLVGVR